MLFQRLHGRKEDFLQAQGAYNSLTIGSHPLKKLLLHIGTEKTGSTAIQAYLSFLRQDSGNLKVPDDSESGGIWGSNFQGLYWWATEQVQGGFTLPELHNAIHTLVRSEANSLLKSTARFSIFSNEHISKCSLSESSRIIDMLNEAFDEVHGICYIRSHIDHLLAAISTAYRAGSTQGPDSLLSSMFRCNRGLNAYVTWSEVNATSFEFREYSRQALRDNDILSDFIGVLELMGHSRTCANSEYSRYLQKQKNSEHNPSLSPQLFKVAQRVNINISKLQVGQQEQLKLRRKALQVLSLNKDRFSLPPFSAQTVEKCLEQCSALEDEILKGAKSLRFSGYFYSIRTQLGKVLELKWESPLKPSLEEDLATACISEAHNFTR